MATFMSYEIPKINQLEQQYKQFRKTDNHYTKLFDLIKQKTFFCANDITVIAEPQLDYVHCCIKYKNFNTCYLFDYDKNTYTSNGKPLDDYWYKFVSDNIVKQNEE